jgi:hypothetical protein
VAFGVFAPPVIFHLDQVLDPLRQGGIRFLPFRPFTPLLAYGAMAALGTWLAMRPRDARNTAVLAGPLLGGAIFALGTGAVLLPLSLLGLAVDGIGALGLVPLVTGVVFLDAGREALAEGRVRLGAARARTAAAAAALLVVAAAAGAGLLVQRAETRATEVILGVRPGDPDRAERRLRTLWLFPGVRLLDLEVAARRGLAEPGSAIPGAYERITGRPVRVPW